MQSRMTVLGMASAAGAAILAAVFLSHHGAVTASPAQGTDGVVTGAIGVPGKTGVPAPGTADVVSPTGAAAGSGVPGGAAGPAGEQPGGAVAPAPRRRAKGPSILRYTAALRLTDEQVKQIQAAGDAARQQAKVVMVDGTLTAPQKTTKLAAIRKTEEQAISGILTAQQRSEMGTLEESTVLERQTGHVLSRWAEPLGLSEEQKGKIQGTLVDASTQMRRLTADPAVQGRNRAVKTRELVTATEGKIQALLTPEQMKKLGELQRQERQEQEVTSLLSRLDSTVALSPEQKIKAQGVLADEAKQEEALREDGKLAPPDRAVKLGQISRETETAIEELLTAPQLEKWKRPVTR